ncbi:MAG: N-formylglutamate amidohydrolase [Oligoflexales bacterium]
MLPYDIILGNTPLAPIIVSVPHCGTAFPPELKDRFIESFTTYPEDTDWFVNKLYDFAPRMGITLISAKYSRYIIDLNRDPSGANLYQDGRKETVLVPSLSFSGKPLYKDAKPSAEDVAERKKKYFDPYYERIASLLKEMQTQHKHVLLFDGHSIKRRVPSIRKEPFPDLILGDAQGKAASPDLTRTALECLRSSKYEVAHNAPFQGGFITRHFGRSAQNIHALQLEMSQEIYMDEERTSLTDSKASKLSSTLQTLLTALIKTLKELK